MASLLLSMPLSAQQTRPIFVFSPDERSGLHVAALDSAGTWEDLGQLCSSDYGTWVSEKRMFHPSLCRAKDGSWRLVFQVNDRSPLFAAAYSRDLLTWRPQDYPQVSTKSCLQPVVFANDDGTFDIYFKSQEGPRFLSASADFRRFGKDTASQIAPEAWTRDTATIGGQLKEGCQFEVAEQELQTIKAHFAWLHQDWRKSSERMHNDGRNPLLTALRQPLKATLRVDMDKQKPISDKLIGIFFEDLSYAADGGLYAELVQNRDFEYTSRDHGGWNATTAWHSPATIRVATDNPLSRNNPHHAIVTTDSLVNEGWDGIAVEKGKRYDFSVYVRGRKQIDVQLIATDGTVIAKGKIKAKGDSWSLYQCMLTATRTETTARLALIPHGTEEAAVDMVSLFPQETFKNRKNGLRRDLAQVIADLHPKFVRFPGGCLSHGQGLENIYHWNETVGPLQDRKPDFNIWNYHQTRGLGFYEYFLFCEDIGAEPLPVLAAGVPCQNSDANAQGIGGQQGGIPMEQMPAYIQEFLELIEWANGDPATSKWARMRAEAGHPAPFNLKYIGIGNEDIIGTTFEDRYEMIARAIRSKYPQIKICGTVGPFHKPSADYTEGWNFTRKHPDLQYMVDEHYYESTGWFMHHRDYYDNYDRSQAKVYLGEWAASTNVRCPNVETALAEALYLTDIERNGDIVEMTSYAPMLSKDGHSNWNPDMIYFTNTTVRTTPAYHVQRLFSTNSGDRYASSLLTIDSPQPDTARQLQHRLGASVVCDTKTGRTILKLVNALPVRLEVSVNGLDIPPTATAEGFYGQPEDQQLNIETGLATSSNIVLPPYSFRVIQIEK